MGISSNSAIPGGQIPEYCRMSPEGEKSYREALREQQYQLEHATV
jgi:hypothetical protein